MRNLIEIINWCFIYETCAHFILVHEELERNNCNYYSRFYLCIHYDKRIPQNVRERCVLIGKIANARFCAKSSVLRKSIILVI